MANLLSEGCRLIAMGGCTWEDFILKFEVGGRVAEVGGLSVEGVLFSHKSVQ